MWDYMNSPDFWKTLLSGVCGAGAATVILVWLGKTWIGERIKRDVEDTYKAKEQQRRAEFDRALEERKAELSRELEGWSAGYKKALDENHVRFSRLHEDRATAIRDLYSHLIKAQTAVASLVFPARFDRVDEEKLRREAHEMFGKFCAFFNENRIFFTEADCVLIDKLTDIVRGAYVDFMAYDDKPNCLNPADQQMRRKLQSKAWEAMKEGFLPVRKQVERELRAAMGMAEIPEPKESR